MVDPISAYVNGYSVKEIVEILTSKYDASEVIVIKYLANHFLPHENISLIAHKEDTGQQNDEIVTATKIGLRLSGLAEFFGEPEFTWHDYEIELGRPSLGTDRKIPIHLFRIKEEDIYKILDSNDISITKDITKILNSPTMSERGKKGGKHKKYKPGLQEAINKICEELLKEQKALNWDKLKVG